MDIIALVVGVALGAVIGFLIAKVVRVGSNQGDSNQADTDSAVKARTEALSNQIEEQKSKLRAEEERNRELIRESAGREERIQALNEQLANKEKDLVEVQKQMKLEFENLANRILDEKSQKFTAQNKENLSDLLKPFADRIRTFEKTLGDTRVETAKERTELTEKIKQLTDLNEQMRLDARNLTKALKGDSKTQGRWGELILERILERSGLTKDREYYTQFSTTNDDNARIQPDVVVRLPEGKHLIIDSKVSLTAYEQYTSAENEEDRAEFLKGHLSSVRDHVKKLSEKKYETSEDIKTLQFVLMFIPVEGGFSLALQHDQGLYNDAYDRNIIIVSPTTLLAVLSTISSIWNQEKQNKNAATIAYEAGKMYDKFVGFLKDMEKIERAMSTGQNTYAEAMKKLKGQGGFSSKIEKLKELGAKTTDQIPERYLEEELPEGSLPATDLETAPDETED